MAKSANRQATSATKRKTDDAVTRAAGRASKSRAQSATVAGGDVARRAYALYLARGCEHGHDVDDWLQAERDLREAESSAA